jgi:hypothetical protein
MKVLLPYLIGAASTFVVQFLIQVYVVPRVQTRKQRHERWLKDVLDLGELLTTSVRRSAWEAWEKQLSFRALKNYSTGPEFDQVKVEQGLRELKLAARQATQEFNDLVNFRVNWVADRIMALSGDSEQAVQFISVSYQYRMKVIQFGPSEYEDKAEDEFDNFWASERSVRNEMTGLVKNLTYLSHPPRASWRRRFRLLWRRFARLLRLLWRKSTRRFRKPEPPGTPPQPDASPPPSSS